MNAIRNSVRAVVVRDGKILLVKMREPSTGEIYYLTPGGGQNPGETFPEALRRECREETGAEVRPLDVVLIREYIGKNHKYAFKHSGVHQVEYFFSCGLAGEPCPEKASETDLDQIGVEWVPCSDLPDTNLYPEAMKTLFDQNGRFTSSRIYLGDTD